MTGLSVRPTNRSRRPVQFYTIVNLAGDYLVNDQIKVFGRVDNLFNLHYQNPTGFLQPGFGIFGGVRMASFGVK
jgi:vitamin B12 transporter